MLILHDPDTLLHSTVELLGAKLIPALESPDRLKAILASLDGSPHEVRTVHIEPSTALSDLIKATHDSNYLHHIESVFESWRAAHLIEQSESVLPECFRFSTSLRADLDISPPKDIFARPGYYAFDMSSGVMADTYKSVLASTNLAYEGTRLLLPSSTDNNDYHGSPPSTPGKSVLALCRPPGHHCDGRRAGGYCYINNAAVAVSTWRSQKSPCPPLRVGIIDLDFHHGNGTQEIFYSDPHTFYASIHGADEFPYYTGAASETGLAPAAVGTNLNLPLPTRSSILTYLAALTVALQNLRAFDPEFLVVSLGFDTFRLDPLGSFDIDTLDYGTIARRVRRELAGVPALIVLEGGYAIQHLGENLLAFLRGWELAEEEG